MCLLPCFFVRKACAKCFTSSIGPEFKLVWLREGGAREGVFWNGLYVYQGKKRVWKPLPNNLSLFKFNLFWTIYYYTNWSLKKKIKIIKKLLLWAFGFDTCHQRSCYGKRMKTRWNLTEKNSRGNMEERSYWLIDEHSCKESHTFHIRTPDIKCSEAFECSKYPYSYHCYILIKKTWNWHKLIFHRLHSP